jgi:hypothetical protein
MAIAEEAVDHQQIIPQSESAQPGAFSGDVEIWHHHGLAEAGAPWHPVDELAQVQADLERLRQRKEALLDMFLTPGADSRFEGQTHVVEVVAEHRRTFDRRRLPAAILQDERFYAVSTCRNVRLVAKHPEPEDVAVIEPFH